MVRSQGFLSSPLHLPPHPFGYLLSRVPVRFARGRRAGPRRHDRVLGRERARGRAGHHDTDRGRDRRHPRGLKDVELERVRQIAGHGLREAGCRDKRPLRGHYGTRRASALGLSPRGAKDPRRSGRRDESPRVHRFVRVVVHRKERARRIRRRGHQGSIRARAGDGRDRDGGTRDRGHHGIR